jgi:hypothetical protein
MQLALTEDQELIAQTAAEFVADKSPVSRFRALRDAGDPVGFSRALWKEMAELGWLGIPFAESLGGAGMGMAELVVVVEALGRSLAPEPFLSCVALAGRALALRENDAQQEAWLATDLDYSHSDAGRHCCRGALFFLATSRPSPRWASRASASWASSPRPGSAPTIRGTSCSGSA